MSRRMPKSKLDSDPVEVFVDGRNRLLELGHDAAHLPADGSDAFSRR
jgi:hypothetical protein